jgi:ubiquinone/menaquinone biosynthesis C-methylase UbiE
MIEPDPSASAGNREANADRQVGPDEGLASFGYRDVPASEKAEMVARVFESVAPRYDLMNDLMSMGVHRLWKNALVDVMNPRPGEKLPFPDRSFDAYTIAFGLRNVTDIDRALGEAYRVLKPGGRYFCLEFSKVSSASVGRLYDAYSERALPFLGRVVARDAESYRYLHESIRRFPPQRELGERLRRAGFARVAWRNMTLGVVALHSGWRI